MQRNVGNQVNITDMNCMACLEYAVNVLKVKHIIVSGHYNCGAVKAALTLPAKTQVMVNYWIQGIREVRDEHSDELLAMEGDEVGQLNRLCELNVMRQVLNLCTSPIVQGAWDRSAHLAVHGIVYSLSTGIATELAPPVTCMQDLIGFTSEADQHKVLRHKVSATNLFMNKSEAGAGGS